MRFYDRSLCYSFAFSTAFALMLTACSGGGGSVGSVSSPSSVVQESGLTTDGVIESASGLTLASVASSNVLALQSTLNSSSSASATSNFHVSGASVTGEGATVKGSSDHYFAASGALENIAVNPAAQLVAYCNNSPSAPATSACGVPSTDLINMGAGTLVNHGRLNSYPLGAAPGFNYRQTSNIVSITNTNGASTQVENYGEIGDESNHGGFYGPIGYYGQGNAAGILISGNADVTNEKGAYLAGYNAFFTQRGAGTFKNYGTVFGVNDAVLTGYSVENYQNAGLVSGIAGYASIHEYGNFVNYGYVLGSDFGVLINSGQFDDYGGAPVAGVTDLGGNPAFNGEVSSVIRGAKGPRSLPDTIGEAVTGGAAIEMHGDAVTINLHDQVIDGHEYLPDISGPIEGGFNGNDSSASTNNTKNILNFSFTHLPSDQAAAFKTALEKSLHKNAKGSFYTGSAKIVYGGITYSYEWCNVAKIEFNDVLLPQ